MRTEDGCIIQECLDGKLEAFGLLVDKYKSGIYAFVYGRLGRFQDAQDVTQEVFVEAYRSLRSLRRWESFVFWLYRIARNLCVDWAKAESRRPDREFISDQASDVLESSSLGSYREGQLNESLREALDAIPDTYREVLILHYFGGMRINDMARAIGASPGAIGMRLSRARAQLKEEMIAMMDTAFEGQRLQASFTFRIVEAVKRIKINPMPRTAGLPWGLSLATGIAIVVMTLGSQMAIHQLSEPLVFPGEITPEVWEMPVDILGAPGTSITAGRQGDIDGGGMDPRNPQNAFLLAPAVGGGTWMQKADMPTARDLAGSAVVDGKIYVIGGDPAAGVGTTKAVEEYDPATNTWTTRADMPTARQGVVAAAVDGIIYAIGGWNDAGGDLLTVEAYDPATDIWTRKADMPTVKTSPGIAVVDGIIYVIGGFGDSGVPGPPWLASSIVYAYDPATDEWTGKADMPTARLHIGVCVIDGQIYVSGGLTKWDLASGVPTMEVYDPATDTWTQASDMPWVRHRHSASVVAGKIYIIGGAGEALQLFSTVDVYDPAAGAWTTAADFPTPRAVAATAVVDGKIYTIGGASSPEAPPISIVEEYDPGLPDVISVTSPAGKFLGTWGNVKSE